MSDLEFHPLAAVFNLMEGKDFDAICDDIRSKGLCDPIVLLDGKILDGRNRYRACLRVGVEPRFIDYEGNDPEAFVDSKNLHRRHLNSEQKREAIGRILRRNPAMSNRQVAAKVGTSPTTVGEVREQLESTVQIGQLEKTVGKDGKERTAKPKPSAKREAVKEMKKKLQEQNGATQDQVSEQAEKPIVPHIVDEPEEAEAKTEGALCDDNGTEVPSQAIEAFSALPELRKFVRSLDATAAALGELGKTPLCAHMHWKAAQQQIQAARKSLWQGRPAYVCPYCKCAKPECKACRGHGFVSAFTYDAAPPEMKEAKA